MVNKNTEPEILNKSFNDSSLERNLVKFAVLEAFLEEIESLSGVKEGRISMFEALKRLTQIRIACRNARAKTSV